MSLTRESINNGVRDGRWSHSSRQDILDLFDRATTAEAERYDLRKAWALLDEPGAELRHAHTAEEAARQFVAKLEAARAEVARVTEAATVSFEVAESERKDLEADLAKVTAERDRLVRECAEECLEANAERDEARATAAQHEKALEATRARCAMLTEALATAADAMDPYMNPTSKSWGTSAREARSAISADDAVVGEWLKERETKLRVRVAELEEALFDRCIQAANGGRGCGLDSPSKLCAACSVAAGEDQNWLAAHDAQVETKTLEKAIAALLATSGISMGSVYAEQAAAVVCALASKDGTTP